LRAACRSRLQGDFVSTQPTFGKHSRYHGVIRFVCCLGASGAQRGCCLGNVSCFRRELVISDYRPPANLGRPFTTENQTRVARCSGGRLAGVGGFVALLLAACSSVVEEPSEGVASADAASSTSVAASSGVGGGGGTTGSAAAGGASSSTGQLSGPPTI